MASVTKTINRGVEYLQQGEPAKAAELYRDVLRRSPNNPDALHLLAVAVYQLGQAPAAALYAERSLAERPDFADGHSNLGRYYFSLGRLQEAVGALDRALRIQPSHAMARSNMALALTALGRREEAAAHLRESARLAPHHPQPHVTLGNLLADLDRQAEAVDCFRRALSLDPNIPEAENNLANSLQALGRLQEALPHYEAALRLRPDYPDALSNKGAALQAMGRFDDARACFEEALRLQPGLIQARGNLGNLLGALGRHEEAIALYREILAETPDSVESWNNLGNCYQNLGRHAEALEAYREALRRKPSYFLVHNNVGNTLRRLGRYQEALASYNTALEADPNFVEAMNNLGVTLMDMGRLTDAVPWFERALALRPGYVDPLINLANNWRDRGRPEQAILLLRQALALAPGNPSIWNNLGCALGDQGVIAEALDCYRKTLALAPANYHANSNLLLNLHYPSGIAPEEIFAAHLEIARRHEPAFARYHAPHSNTRDPDRPLRIGYVSADFRRHSVAYFLEPVLERHNAALYPAYCYADVTRADAVTDRFRTLAGDRWRDLRGSNTESFVSLVRADAIDILVDLGGHTANSRLMDFAARPAPVQVSWLGYPNTTGLQAIGYRLTDADSDPPGLTEHRHTETLVRLDGSFLCFRPPVEAPPVSPPPSAAGEPFTFGSFNSMSKLSDELLAMWAEILHRVPGSRIAIKNKALSETEARRRLLDAFAAHGIPNDRVLMAGLIDGLAGHLDAYRLVDLALDSWPYHGTTTTCEAFWMGVPVVTRLGDTHVSRVGASLLNSVGLTEFATTSRGAYIAKAAELASQRNRLASIRATLRERMRASRLVDETGFTRNLESAYRRLWRRWCEGPTPN